MVLSVNDANARVARGTACAICHGKPPDRTNDIETQVGALCEYVALRGVPGAVTI